jgi:hypothetical protein
VEGGRVLVEVAVTELPGVPIIDTPKDHQRRELLVPAFVVMAVRRYLATLPGGPGVFVFRAGKGTPRRARRATAGLPAASTALSPPRV